jgi:phage FluMu gp28-like protein
LITILLSSNVYIVTLRYLITLSEFKNVRETWKSCRYNWRKQCHWLISAKRFILDGAQVFTTGRRQNELDTAVSEFGQNVTDVQGDVKIFQDLASIYVNYYSRSQYSR